MVWSADIMINKHSKMANIMALSIPKIIGERGALRKYGTNRPPINNPRHLSLNLRNIWNMVRTLLQM